MLTSALTNLSQHGAGGPAAAAAARKLLRHPAPAVRADAARYLGQVVFDEGAREGLQQLARVDDPSGIDCP